MNTAQLLGWLLWSYCCMHHMSARLLIIEDFYSHSFVPDMLQVSYHIDNHIGIYYNVSVNEVLPGKILLNFFIRKYCQDYIFERERNANEEHINSHAEWQCEDTATIVRYKNLDFCETLDFARNLTAENYSGEDFLQPTFITSCPLIRGHYYIVNATIDTNIIPRPFENGRYLAQVELIQVFREITKLSTTKAICFYEND